MKLFQITLGLLTVAALVVPADAQLIRDQLTRRGTVAGAVIGGIVGNQNNEAAAGIILGGLVGGVAGRAISNHQSQRVYNNGYGQSYYQQPTYVPQQNYHVPQRNYHVPQQNYHVPQQSFHVPHQNHHVPQGQFYQQPVYAPQHQGGGFGHSIIQGW